MKGGGAVIKSNQGEQQNGIALSPERIENFLGALYTRGCVGGTLDV